MKSHFTRCYEEPTVNEKKEFKNCMKFISKANIPRHRKFCHIRKQRLEEIDELDTLTARVYKADKKECTRCGTVVSAANIARYLK